MYYEVYMISLKAKIKAFPDSPGIYLFYDRKKSLVYVGKATSLRNRVRSYFSGKTSSRPIEEMIHEVHDIKIKKTDSVLEAIILESIYIKKYEPKYNVLGKDNKSWNYIAITKDEYPRIETIRSHQLRQLSTKERQQTFAKLFGPFPGLNAKATLRILRKLFGFCTCKPGQKSCMYYQMKQCEGVFKKEISPTRYKQKIIRPLTLFLQGRKKDVVKTFEKEMKAFSKQEQFEDAAKRRNQIAALQRIQDIALINKSFFEKELHYKRAVRIEGYDISNLGSSGVVGSMVAFEHDVPRKDRYRKFKIKTFKGQSDVGALAEVLERRLKHQEWIYPDIILVDGGKPQVNTAKKVVASFGLSIPVIGIAKGPARKKNEFIFGTTKSGVLAFIKKHEDIFVRVRDEAHRFAIKYQRSLRRLKKS